MLVRRLIPVLVTSLLTILAVMSVCMLAARPALAASSTGSQKLNYTVCSEYDGYSACYCDQGVYHFTRTPSGNILSTFNGTFSYTITNTSGAVVDQASIRYGGVNRTKDSMLQTYNNHGHGTYTFEGMTCITRYVYTIANGQLRVSRDTNLCSYRYFVDTGQVLS